ncbi:peptidoglycan DD-metalloendopeptidase family protein [Leucobacter albus]|uniref:Peptidoglycan DD-metalloendopeptidase family protein n=1 Tax=Leucobacter albus TaxID=272210 RepID=A0ABW3THW7_9MICO
MTSTSQPRLRRRAGLTLGMAAAGAVLLSGLSVGGLTPASAIVSDLPTWQDVENAKQNEAAAAAKVTEIKALLVQVQQEVERTRAESETASVKYDQAASQLRDAQARMETLDTQAKASEAEAGQASEQAAGLVSQIYRSGGVDRNLSLFLESDGSTADALLDRLAQTEKATERNTTIWQNAERAMNSAQTLGEQADSARAERDKLAQEADDNRQRAAEIADAARTKQLEQEANEKQLQQQLEALEDKTTNTTKGYQERLVLEEQERQRLEAERREAERRAAEEAANNANNGGGGGTAPGGGGGTTNPGGGGGTATGWALPLPRGYWVSTEWWGYYGHTGMDLAIGQGTPIYAAAAGTVSFSGWAGQYSYGNMASIDHGGGVSTLYGHMQYTPSVSLGQYVGAGQFIGYVGSTGNSTGPHLHFETLVGGVPTNPRPFMANRGIYF